MTLPFLNLNLKLQHVLQPQDWLAIYQVNSGRFQSWFSTDCLSPHEVDQLFIQDFPYWNSERQARRCVQENCWSMKYPLSSRISTTRYGFSTHLAQNVRTYGGVSCQFIWSSCLIDKILFIIKHLEDINLIRSIDNWIQTQ